MNNDDDTVSEGFMINEEETVGEGFMSNELQMQGLSSLPGASSQDIGGHGAGAYSSSQGTPSIQSNHRTEVGFARRFMSNDPLLQRVPAVPGASSQNMGGYGMSAYSSTQGTPSVRVSHLGEDDYGRRFLSNEDLLEKIRPGVYSQNIGGHGMSAYSSTQGTPNVQVSHPSRVDSGGDQQSARTSNIQGMMSQFMSPYGSHYSPNQRDDGLIDKSTFAAGDFAGAEEWSMFPDANRNGSFAPIDSEVHDDSWMDEFINWPDEDEPVRSEEVPETPVAAMEGAGNVSNSQTASTDDAEYSGDRPNSNKRIRTAMSDALSRESGVTPVARDNTFPLPDFPYLTREQIEQMGGPPPVDPWLPENFRR